LEELGLEIESVKGRGYRIPGGLELLDDVQIKAGLTAQNEAMLTHLIIDQVTDSTNAEALRRVALGAGSGVVCTAEQQSSGRGRRGRAWVSPFARNV
jgi:BirA family biotin operon repressor/biotin-[acetyl-CoA-carboxylase] ligase